jgi:hypothetical protein
VRPVRWSASLNGGDARGPNNFVAAASLRRRRTAKETRGMVCDGERVAAPPVAELELAFEVGAWRRAASPHMSDHRRFTRDLMWLRRKHPALRGEGLNVFHVHNDKAANLR